MGATVGKARRRRGRALRGGGAQALTEGHAGALAGEDEDEGGDELGERRLEGTRVVHLLVAPDGDPADRHSHSHSQLAL